MHCLKSLIHTSATQATRSRNVAPKVTPFRMLIIFRERFRDSLALYRDRRLELLLNFIITRHVHRRQAVILTL